MTSFENEGTTPMAARRHFYNRAPKGLPPDAPVDAALAEFGRRLQKRMSEKGYNQSDLAREASKHMPNKKFGRDNISNYVRGVVFPGPIRLHALAKALGVKPDDLVPEHGLPSTDDRAPPYDIRATSDGNVWLRVNQAVSHEVAMKVLALLGQDKN